MVPLIIVLVLLGTVGFLVLMYVTQRSLVYYPSSERPPGAASVLPGAQEIELVTDDSLRLGAWYVAATGPPSGITFLVCNGNAGNRSDRAGLAKALAHQGHAVLLFDYRGFAGNPGTPTETGLRADARAALAHLRARGDVDRDRIVYFGESLGAAVASGLASEDPPYALVLRSPFTSLAEVGRFHYPYLPVIDPLLMDRYPVSDAIAELRMPLLVVAGDLDAIVPLAISRKVHDRFDGTKKLVIIPGTKHNDARLAEGPELIAAIEEFLTSLGGWLTR